MRTTTIIDIATIRAIVADVGLDAFMDEMIERLHGRFVNFDPTHTTAIDRTGFSYEKPDLGLVEWMPTMESGGMVSIKTVGYHPTNPTQRSMPSVMATTSLHDTTSGRLLLLTDATFLTAVRTGAASALATDVLAPLSATTVGVIGAGAQAVSQIHAISRVRSIDQVLASDADPDIVATLADRLPVDCGVTIIEQDDLATMLAEVDILCTCTSVDPQAGPVFDDGDHKPDLHVNAVGADFPGKLEVPRTMIERALVIPDNTRQCLAEGEAQTLTEADLGPDLFHVIIESDPSRREGLTVFDSTGWALEDLVAAELALEHAERLGLGLEVELQPIPEDPYDPYEPVR